MAIKIAGVDVINDDRELVLAKLTDINETISSTAVDVFVYDTSKDSDGGAWRHRTQHTSWYAEASSASRDVNTRSTRAEFPAVAVIVAESNKVTIYDGDDPSLPMWMVFEADTYNFIRGQVSSVAFKNGEMFSCSNTIGSSWVSFPADKSVFSVIQINDNFRGVGGIANRNNNVTSNRIQVTDNNFFIVNSVANDVAMTVLPDAPTDPATGLPVPTIACLVAETEVLMADGSTKRLDQVQPGAMVKTLEGEHRVLNWWDQGIKDVIELEFEGRHKITCTADHKIRTTTGWVEAGDLTEDHEVVVA